MKKNIEQPKVTVIITTYNRPKSLKKAIDSVLDQTFENFELIIINDASVSDETRQIITSNADVRIIYIENDKNLGSAKSLNIGLNAARGEYIAILDDDDWWRSKEKLETQVNFLEKNKEHVLLGTNCVVVNSNGKEMLKTEIPLQDDALRKIILKTNPIAHSSVMFRRNVAIAVGGYDKELFRGKDYDLWLKMAKLGKIAVLPECTVAYRNLFYNDRADFFEIKKNDSVSVLKILWKYRKEYPGFSTSFLTNIFRCISFYFLEKVQYFYYWACHDKTN